MQFEVESFVLQLFDHSRPTAVKSDPFDLPGFLLGGDKCIFVKTFSLLILLLEDWLSRD